jgi:hypothetical protein
MCVTCDKTIEQLTQVERAAGRNQARELGMAMMRGIDAAGFKPTCVTGFVAVAAAARALASTLEATMGPKTVELVEETAGELAAEKLAAIGYSMAGSH